MKSLDASFQIAKFTGDKSFWIKKRKKVKQKEFSTHMKAKSQICKKKHWNLFHTHWTENSSKLFKILFCRIENPQLKFQAFRLVCRYFKEYKQLQKKVGMQLKWKRPSTVILFWSSWQFAGLHFHQREKQLVSLVKPSLPTNNSEGLFLWSTVRLHFY